MKELEISELANQESFINYCLQSNKEDVAYWENWLNENQTYKNEVLELKASILLLTVPASTKVIDHDFQLLQNSIAANLRKEQLVTRKVKLWPRIAAIAASIAIIAGGVHFFINYNTSGNDYSSKWVNDIQPGGHKAILKLANGKSVVLNESKKGVVFDDARMVYNDGTALSLPPEDSVQMLTVETPRGGQYETTLSDGTHVWLNAASSISFPSEFSGTNRTVRLSGEAYLEVAKDKNHPFIVQSGTQEIQVLGTHFNVNSYSDESAIVTTLLEGSVRITKSSLTAAKENHKDPAAIILKPGQQARFTPGDQILKTDVNTKDAIAWKHGKFVFMDEQLGSIMRKISRWYDVDIIYKGVDPNERYWGSVSKYEKVSKVLEKLELTGSLHFNIEGKKLYVTQ